MNRSAQHHCFSFFHVICSQLPVTRTPDNSNLLQFPLRVRVIGIRLYFWLSFSRSQPDFEGFLRAVRFPPSSKSTSSLIHLAVVHTLVVFRGRAPCWLHSSFDPTSLSCVLRNSVSDCERGRLAGQILLTAQSEPIAILK